MLWTYLFVFVNQPSPSNQNLRKQTCNRATFRSSSVKRNCWSVKTSNSAIFQGEKTKFLRKIPRLDAAVKTQIPRLGSKFHRPQKTAGPSHQWILVVNKCVIAIVDILEGV